MTQLPLELTPPEEKPPWRTVRPTSRGSYALDRERLHGREGDTLRRLAAYWNAHHEHPTVGELTRDWLDRERPDDNDPMAFRFWRIQTARGMWDLKARGDVEAVPGGERKCRISKRSCCVWKVTSR